MESLDQLEREHDSISAVLADVFLKNKKKIEDAYDQFISNINFIQDSITSLTNSFKFSHSLPAVKLLYYQEVMMRFNDFTQLMPNLKSGDRMV